MRNWRKLEVAVQQSSCDVGNEEGERGYLGGPLSSGKKAPRCREYQKGDRIGVQLWDGVVCGPGLGRRCNAA